MMLIRPRNLKIAIILGTRPEIIKMSPIIRYCEKKDINYFVIHTNQHYLDNMNSIFFRDLKLPHPDYNLEIGQCSHAVMTGKMLIGIEKILLKEKPDIVLVEGDTNTVLAGALAAYKLHIKVGHVEAGLRSYDRSMPEEINRVIVDHISDFLFVPTDLQKTILLKEGINKDKIFVVGNTIVDAVYQNLKIAEEKVKFNYKKESYFLVTAHRQENVDNKEKLGNILSSLRKIREKFNFRIIYSIHPRTKKRIKEFGLAVPEVVELIEPLGYLKFLLMIKNAKLVITDSGGIQEEACILNTPCVTIRENTERPETVDVAANIVAGTNVRDIIKSVRKMLKKDKSWTNPFGDGNTSRKILDILMKRK